jgi:hypothetical protein
MWKPPSAPRAPNSSAPPCCDARRAPGGLTPRRPGGCVSANRYQKKSFQRLMDKGWRPFLLKLSPWSTGRSATLGNRRVRGRVSLDTPLSAATERLQPRARLILR